MTDHITSLFQVGAIIFLCMNIYKIIHDRQLKGVSTFMIMYFTLWGYWGIYMFWSLNQFWSMITNIGIAVAYTIWLVLSILFVNRKDGEDNAVL